MYLVGGANFIQNSWNLPPRWADGNKNILDVAMQEPKVLPLPLPLPLTPAPAPAPGCIFLACPQ